MDLDERDRSLLAGDEGPALELAMRVVQRVGEIAGATHLVDIVCAHIDANFFQGEAHLDFADYLDRHQARFRVPTRTNSCPISLLDTDVRPPERHPALVTKARRLARLYEKLGCQPVWTCAPYHLPDQPGLGDHIVESESNAVIYYNSVVGARSNKYGDFLDVCAALVGRAPYYGLHTDAGRRGVVLFEVDQVGEPLRERDAFYHLLGFLIGREAGGDVPVVSGLSPSASNDDLRAVAAAIGATGSAGMFHAIGLTPEAPSAEAAFQGRPPARTVRVSAGDLLAARDSLCRGSAGALDFVALGTPHFSLAEFERSVGLLDGRRIAAGTRVNITTSRHVKQQATTHGWIDSLERAGTRIIVDTCTYFAPPVEDCRGRVMTNSAKWAYYAPGMMDIEVLFGSLEECIESAVRGEVWTDASLWRVNGGSA